MMRLTFGFAYGESDTLQALVLPYASEGFSALIVLPRTGKRLADVESTLTPAGIEELRRARTHPEVEVHLPRFKLQSEFDLEAPLRKMGMASAFSPHADFSGITPRKPFFVEAALHAANIDVDEEGTTAASSTFLLLSEGAVTRRAVFNANRPFLFMICDNILV
jgi:serpin B